MSPLSIGVLCLPSLGGSSVIASELAMGLAARGHRLHLFASALPSRAATGVRAGALQFHAIEAPGYPALEHAPYTLAAASKLIDVCRDQPLDLLQVHYAIPHAACGAMACAALGTDAPLLITSLHGTDVTHIGSSPVYRSIVSATIAASAGATVPSEFLKREALRRLDLPSRLPIEVIPNFVDTQRFTPVDARASIPTFCHVSNFRPIKRIDALLDVFARVHGRCPARLQLIGDGPERPFAEARARSLGLINAIDFLGDRPDFVPYLQRADAFLLTSESESFGLAALEAMSCGVPVFAFRVGGLPEVVTPEAGFLAEPNAAALADALLDALSTPGRLAAMGAAARRRAVDFFQVDPALDRTENYFRRLLAERQERS